jgi:hypothetical protein
MAQDKHDETQTKYDQPGSKTLEQKTSLFARAKAKFHKNPRATALSAILVAVILGGGITVIAKAETYPGGTDNGLTSRILSLSNTLTTDGYGSTTNSPDWGALWNRIATAGEYTPAGNAAVSDVKSGQTFTSNSRTQQTGTYPAPGPCSTEAYHDSYGAPVTQTTNCTANITWTVRSPSVTGDDSGGTSNTNTDPRTGLTWSKYLANSSGTATFAASGGSSAWSWDASGTNNVAVGNKTAITLCSSMNGGGVWRTPTQKELMQAYIDGSYFNLSNPSNNFWSATQNSSTNAWYVSLSSGGTSNNTFATLYSVRCVR